MRFKNKAKNKKYRSGSEEKLAKILRANSIQFYYEHHLLQYIVPEQVKNYWPDFWIKNKWNDVYIEFKGRFSGTDRKKMLAVKKENPYLDIRLIFEQDRIYSNKTTKKKLRYSDWAKKHGFKYHVGISLPKDWISELKSEKN